MLRVFILLFPLLTGCALFNVEKADTRILLTVPKDTQQFSQHKASVSLATIATNPILDTSAILIISNNLLTKLKGAIWAENIPIMLQYILLNTLQESDLFSSISTDTDGILAEHTIQNTLTKWYIVRTAKEYSVVGSIHSSIVQKRKNIIVAQKSWEYSYPIAQFSTGEIFNAFQKILNNITKDWLQWINATIPQ